VPIWPSAPVTRIGRVLPGAAAIFRLQTLTFATRETVERPTMPGIDGSQPPRRLSLGLKDTDDMEAEARRRVAQPSARSRAIAMLQALRDHLRQKVG
jgi:hypothetical protein